MTANSARQPLATLQPAQPKNGANIAVEADKENADKKHNVPEATKEAGVQERRPSQRHALAAEAEECQEWEAQLAERERAVAQREQKAEDQSLALRDQVSDLEVKAMRIKERTRALNEREAAAAAQDKPLEQVVDNKHQEREVRLVTREREVAQAEAASTVREQDLAKREDALQRAERQLRVRESSTGEHRCLQAEATLNTRELSLKAREEAVVRAEEIEEREARVTRKESALAERERAVAAEAKAIAAQGKAMADRSRELNIRESSVTERQRQLDTRATQLARESARLSAEASRITAERIALKAEVSEFQARRATYATRASTAGGSARGLLDDCEPTWHSVADDGQRSQCMTDSEDEVDSRAPVLGHRVGNVRGSLDGLLSLAELTGNLHNPTLSGCQPSSARLRDAPSAGHSKASSRDSSAKSVRFVPETSRNAAEAGPGGVASSASYTPAIGSSASSSYRAHSVDRGTGSTSALGHGNSIDRGGLTRAALNMRTPSQQLPMNYSASTSKGDARGSVVPAEFIESDRISIASSVNTVNGGKRHLTARKNIGRTSTANDSRSSVLASKGGHGLAASHRGPLSASSSEGPRASEAAGCAAQAISGRLPQPGQEDQPATPGAFSRFTAPLSALRRSIGGALGTH